MTPPIIDVESDFSSHDETCAQRRHRLCQPRRRLSLLDAACIAVIALGGGLAFLLAVFVAYGLLVIA